MLAEQVYLDSYLAPLARYLGQPDVTDIYVNRPGELWIETLGQVPQRIEEPALTTAALTRLARQIAAVSSQGISREHPLLSASLPDGARVQIVLPPATRGPIALAFRRHVVAEMSLDEYVAGATKADAIIAPIQTRTENPQDVASMLKAAVRGRRNILISGGTSTGKTTFLNTLLKEIPADERLILIEDTPELQIVHTNAVGLLATRGTQGEAEVTAEDLLIASLRMRPDRIILGEMRGSEALTFLRAVNTGHPGSLSTIHADTPQGAIDQLVMLALQAGSRMRWEDVDRYVRRTIDYIVQLERRNGVRQISVITEPASMGSG